MKESAITGNSSTHLAGVHAHAIRPVADNGDEDRHERGVVQEAGEEHRRHHEAQDGDADASGCFFLILLCCFANFERPFIDYIDAEFSKQISIVQQY